MILQELEKAVSLYGEAQNAYDFHAHAQASEMRRDASRILFAAFAESTKLRQHFPAVWTLLLRGDENCGFFYADLERARELLRDEV